MEISYILAGYNEASLVEETIQKCIEMLNRDFDDYELILVDDASTDQTGIIMKEWAQKKENIIFIENYLNLNFGSSVLRGILAASKEYIVFNAIDRAFPLESTKEVIEHAYNNHLDVLVLEREGYRCTKWRTITSKGNQVLLRILFPGLSKDTPVMNYVQVYRREVVRNIIPLARGPIFVWPEMIFRAKIAGYKVGNLKNQCRIERGKKGSFGRPHDIVWGLYEMFRFRIHLYFRKM